MWLHYRYPKAQNCVALCSNDAPLSPEHAKNYLGFGCRKVSGFFPHPEQPRTSNLHPWKMLWNHREVLLSGYFLDLPVPVDQSNFQTSASKELPKTVPFACMDHRIPDDSKLDGMKLMLKLPNWNNLARQETLHDIFVLWGGFKVHKVVLDTTFNGVMRGNFFLSWQRLIRSCIIHQYSCCLCICMYTRSTLYTNVGMKHFRHLTILWLYYTFHFISLYTIIYIILYHHITLYIIVYYNYNTSSNFKSLGDPVVSTCINSRGNIRQHQATWWFPVLRNV